MGLFEQFPYANFHELNLDWLLSKTKELAKTVYTVEALVTALKAEIDDFIDNLDLQEEVNTKLDQMAADGYFTAILSGMFDAYKQEADSLIKSYSREIDGDIVLNLFTKSRNVNGGCYIGNNRFAIYFADPNGDTGLLRIYDATLHTILNEAAIQAYHGNSMTYKDGYLYICACYSASDVGTLLPNIIVVDVNDISTIASVLYPPLSGIYSLTWSPDTAAFYAIAARGTTPGEANRLYKLNESLDTIIGYTDLVNYPALTGRSTQGVQTVHDGIAYTLDYTNKAIIANDIETGQLIFDNSVVNMFNGYRQTGELEFLTVDENDNFYLGCSADTVGEYGATGGTVAKVGIYRNVPHRVFKPLGVSEGGSAASTPIVVLDMRRFVRPATTDGEAFMLGDALNLLKRTTESGEIRIGATLPADWDGAAFTLDGYHGLIIGLSATNKIPTKFVKAYGCTCEFWNLAFIDTSSAQYLNGGYTATGAICLFDTKCSESSCTFDNGLQAVDGMFYDMSFTETNYANLTFGGLRSIMRVPVGYTLAGYYLTSNTNNTVIRTQVDIS